MKRLAALLTCLFAMLSPAAAEPPACRGQNLLTKLAADDPEAHAQVLAEAGRIRNGEALLWRVSREGVPDSWLFGTAHVTDPRVTTLPPQVADALGSARTVALELKEIRNPQEMALASFPLARLMVLPAGQSLWDLIPDADEAMIKDNPNMPPGAAKTVFGYQPWVVATMLSIPACETARNAAGIASLDERIAKTAEANGAELVGLETLEEQFMALSGMPVEQQIDFLLAVSRTSASIADQFETLIQLYEQRRITAMIPLSLRLHPPNPDEAKIMAYIERDLIVLRNHRMAERAGPLLAVGEAFIAVGALHLPGDEGLVELIRQAGYKVTPVN